MSNEIIAKKLIKNNIHLSLSTCDGKNPWVAPLRYIFDKKYNFYFISPAKSLHAKHIAKNSSVSFAIFDSKQPIGKSEGLQASGKAYILKNNYPPIVRSYLDSIKNLPIQLDKYIVFKVVPTKMFIVDSKAWKKEGIDRRIEVKLN